MDLGKDRDRYAERQESSALGVRGLLACRTQPYQHITLKSCWFQVDVSFDKHLLGNKTAIQSRNMKNRRAALMGKLNFPLNTPPPPIIFYSPQKMDGGKEKHSASRRINV